MKRVSGPRCFDNHFTGICYCVAVIGGGKRSFFWATWGVFSAILQVATRKNRPVLIIRPCSLGLVVRKKCATSGSLLNPFSVISFHMWPTLDFAASPKQRRTAMRSVCFSFVVRLVSAEILRPGRVALCCCGCDYLGGVPEHC